MGEFELIPVLSVAVPVLAVVTAWFLNERSKRQWEAFKRKEESYQELLVTLRGFYERTDKPELKVRFLNQVNLCWLHAPDDVITEAYEFLATVEVGADSGNADKQRAAGDLVAAVRRDLLSRKVLKKTELEGSDFRHLGAT